MLSIAAALSPLSFVGGLTPLVQIQPQVTRVGPEPFMFAGKSSAKPKKAAKVAKKPAAKKPAAKKVAKKPAAKKVVKKPVAKKPPVKKPVVKKPVVKARPGKAATLGDLQALALEQNTALGYWDPLKLAEKNFWDQGNEATIGWLRHAEIKHGRVAMAAFVGYCIQANGITFPWPLVGGPLSQGETITFADIAAAGSPPDQWDAVPTAAKVQILLFVFLLEWVGESPSAEPHYMRGGKPGYYPSLKDAPLVPHPVPFDLYDPFDLFGEMDEETKARRRNMEINNGRLAMLGIFSFLSASKGLIVPGLNDVIQPYNGEYMAYFAAGDVGLPFVKTMLDFNLTPP